MNLEDALFIACGSNWHNPIHPYFVSSCCISADEAYKNLDASQRVIVDRAMQLSTCQHCHNDSLEQPSPLRAVESSAHDGTIILGRYAPPASAMPNLYELALGVANDWATQQYGDDYLNDEMNRNGMVDLANMIFKLLKQLVTPPQGGGKE